VVAGREAPERWPVVISAGDLHDEGRSAHDSATERGERMGVTNPEKRWESADGVAHIQASIADPRSVGDSGWTQGRLFLSRGP
jgi:hypothetical protein